MFEPIDRMWDRRVEVARQKSDTSLFLALLLLGELVMKAATAGLVAAVQDDRERHRYGLLHQLVRANGLGDWSRVAREALKWPVSEHLTPPAARDEQRQLTEKIKPDSWQWKALSLLDETLEQLNVPELHGRQDIGLQWLDSFTHLRNKCIRSHGAEHDEQWSKACPSLEQSIRLFEENFCLFQRPWAYLYRNQSGKYWVTNITAKTDGFEALKESASQDTVYEDGVYVYFDRPTRVELIVSDADLSDFYLPNGSFTGKRYDLISYESNEHKEGDAAPYRTLPVQLPRSETAGGGLDVPHGWNCYSNVPPCPTGYVRRHDLEEDLRQQLTRGHNAIITLKGMGGVGKTSLALSVLHDIATQQEETFEYILWFSARDVDLLPHGPQPVTPDVLTAQDIAKQFVRLIEPPDAHNKNSKAAMTYFYKALEEGAEGMPTLLVFDNFETVRNKLDVYQLIDDVIKPPNRVLITTRDRGFTGDRAIEVKGMTADEAQDLIDRTARDLRIEGLVTDKYCKRLYKESEGHPYVMKILLGEVAKYGPSAQIPRITASKERILDALFERTYKTLSPQAQRVFLNLSNWRSVLPQLALEAALLSDAEEERIDVEEVVEELYQSSFAEIQRSPEDGELFVSVPLTASLFGRRKLPVSPMKYKVEADLELLRKFGATQQTDIQLGIRPKVKTFFRNVERERGTLTQYLPMLELVADRYPPSWRNMASLYERSPAGDSLDKAKRAVEQYLERPPQPGDEQERIEAWKKLAELRGRTGDFTGQVSALQAMCALPGCPIEDISYSAKRVLEVFRQDTEAWDREVKRRVAGDLADQMEKRIAELYPSDFALLAWLRLHTNEGDKAKEFTKQGLKQAPDNEHLKRVASRLWS